MVIFSLSINSAPPSREERGIQVVDHAQTAAWQPSRLRARQQRRLGNLTPTLSLERRGSKKCRALLSWATCPPRAVGMAPEKSGQETSPHPSPWKGEGARNAGHCCRRRHAHPGLWAWQPRNRARKPHPSPLLGKEREQECRTLLSWATGSLRAR